MKNIMLDNEIKNMFKKVSEVKLDEQKKQQIHANVLSFMQKNPYIGKRVWWFNYRSVQVSLAALLLVVLVGGGAVVKADSSLPGDWLYPVKIGVNERVAQALAFSDEAKLQVNVKLANRRLQEAEQLTVQGKMNPDKEKRIRADFKTYVDGASIYIKKINKAKKNKHLPAINVDFENLLRAHATGVDVPINIDQ